MSSIPKFYTVKRKDNQGKPIVKDCQIKMIVTIPAGRVEYYTRLSVDQKYFIDDYIEKKKDPIKQSAPFADNLNDKLKLIYNDAITLANKIIASKENVSVREFKERLNAIHNPKLNKEVEDVFTFVDYLELLLKERRSGIRLKPSGQQFAVGTTNKLRDLIAVIERYISHNKIKALRLDDINDKFYSSFKEFVYEVEKKRVSTFGRFVKDIKMAVSEALSDGYISNNPTKSKMFISPKIEVDTIALTKEQLDILYNFEFNDNTIDKIELENLKHLELGFDHLESIRDMFLIGCYSALRYSDLNMVSIESITPQFMRVYQKKTKQRVTIPVSSRLQSILKKYDNGLPKLRFKGLHSYNFWLKKIMEIVGFNESVTIKDSQGGKITTKTVPFYSLVSSHTARRTYATIMFLSGVPTLLIMAVTGHKTEASFLKYIRATNEDKARLMAEYMQKLNF